MSNLLLTVLSDGESFGGAHGSAIILGPDENNISDEVIEELQDGELPMLALEVWPFIDFNLKANGDLVAVLHGVPSDTDGREILLVSKGSLKACEGVPHDR